jgi:imidazolonepropionase-like amidohydrolase
VNNVFGTDLLGGMHRHQFSEFRLPAEVQHPPDVIRSAMSTTASLFDAQRTSEVIALGACADLVAVDGDPLHNITQLTCCPEQYHRLLTEVVARWLTFGH